MTHLIEEIARRHGAADTGEIEELWGYSGARIWRVGNLIVKLSRAVAHEAWALKSASAAGVPVPDVLGQGEDERLPGGRYLVMRYVDGEEMPVSLARAVGAALRQLHSVTVDGYGPLDAPRASWAEALSRVGQPALVAAWEPYLRDVPCVLLHGDIQQCHLRVADGSIAGIIDFGSAWGGDPAWDLARAFSGVGTRGSFELADALLPAVLEGYGPVETLRMPLYRALVAAAEHESNVRHGWTEWIDSSAEVLRERIDAARI